jgi:hypothetical protein
MFRVCRHLIRGAAVLAAVTNLAAAQSLVPLTRNQFGISGTLIRPTGQFQQFVDWGGGLGTYFVAGMDAHGILGIRVDGSALWYGHESWDIWLGPRLPYSYLRASTDNMIFSLGVGPQVTFGTGRVRPYGFGTAGFSYFVTWSSVSGVDGYDYESNTNFDDMSFALSAGGGLLTQIAGRHKPVFLDMAAHWTHNGTTDYLREGSIVDSPDGSMIMLPIRSEANHWSFRLGVTFAF